MPDLTTLADVRAWLAIPDAVTNTNTMLSRLITAVSNVIVNYLNRDSLVEQVVTEIRDGGGKQRIVLRSWPVLSVTSVTVDGSAIPAQTDPPFGSGYRAALYDGVGPGQAGYIDLFGSAFTKGRQNCTIVYTTGYVVSGEAQAIPATPYQIAASSLAQQWAQDQGVTFADGTALTKVASSPTTGQYSCSSAGLYTFAAADAGQAILITYSFTPAEIAQAAIEAVALRFRERDRIGMISKGAGGETTTYSQRDLPDDVKMALSNYRNVGGIF